MQYLKYKEEIEQAEKKYMNYIKEICTKVGPTDVSHLELETGYSSEFTDWTTEILAVSSEGIHTRTSEDFDEDWEYQTYKHDFIILGETYVDETVSVEYKLLNYIESLLD